MALSPLSRAVIRFDVFEVDLRVAELRKHGRKIKLQDQPFRILGMLLERSGEVVTREEMREKLWPADTFVDFEHGLNSAVARLREALNDSAEKPRFIETVPRRGYRFIAPVQQLISQTPPAVPEMQSTRWGKYARWLAVSAILLIAFCAIGVSRFLRYPTKEAMLPFEIVPLAAVTGFEHDPAFSPDGNQVAFALSGSEGCGIYTTMVGGGLCDLRAALLTILQLGHQMGGESLFTAMLMMELQSTQ